MTLTELSSPRHPAEPGSLTSLTKWKIGILDYWNVGKKEQHVQVSNRGWINEMHDY